VSTQRFVGLVLVLLVSLSIGLATGHWFYRLYVDSIPEALKATTSLAGTRVVFLWKGMMLGLGIALWTIVAVAAARFFRPRAPKETGATRIPPSRV